MRMPILQIPLRTGAVLFCIMAIMFASAPMARAATQPTAMVRVIHASPDVGIVDVFVDGKELLRSFQFATVTEYLPLPAGTHSVELALLGKGVNASIVTERIQVKDGVAYTIAGLGTKSSGFSFTVFQDDNIAPKMGAKVRVYHLAPGTGSAQVKVSNTSTTISGLNYKQASNYVTMGAGKSTFTLYAGPKNVKLPLTVTLKDWNVASIFAIGEQEGTPKLQLISTQVMGIPGLPDTGSDPSGSVSALFSLSWQWLSAFLLVAIGLLYLLSRIVRHRSQSL